MKIVHMVVVFMIAFSVSFLAACGGGGEDNIEVEYKPNCEFYAAGLVYCYQALGIDMMEHQWVELFESYTQSCEEASEEEAICLSKCSYKEEQSCADLFDCVGNCGEQYSDGF